MTDLLVSWGIGDFKKWVGGGGGGGDDFEMGRLIPFYELY